MSGHSTQNLAEVIAGMQQRGMTLYQIGKAIGQINRARKKNHLPPLKHEKKLKRRNTRPDAPPKGIPYAEYLRSEWWLFKRKQKLGSVQHKCERCGREATQVHHKHYRTLGREKHRDLEAICRSCHSAEHEALIQADQHLRSVNNASLA
jgi:5-methylcytosine-specific restriction endonuclease McrA